MRLNVVILLGSVRSDRKGLRVARFVECRLAERGHSVTLVDPQALQLPLLDRMYKEYRKGEAPQVLEILAALYRRAVSHRRSAIAIAVLLAGAFAPTAEIGRAHV